MWSITDKWSDQVKEWKPNSPLQHLADKHEDIISYKRYTISYIKAIKCSSSRFQCYKTNYHILKYIRIRLGACLLKNNIQSINAREKLQRRIEGKKDSMRNRKRERKAPQQGLKGATPDRSTLPPSHRRILILMKLPVIALFPPSDHLNMKNLKSTNSRSCVSQFDPEPHSRHQPWQTRCSKRAGAAFIRRS